MVSEGEGKPIHYVIKTEYGRLECDFYETRQLGDSFESSFKCDPDIVQYRPTTRGDAAAEGSKEQVEHWLHEAWLSIHRSAARSEFIHGLPDAIRHGLGQHFELCKIGARVQHERGGLSMKPIDIAFSSVPLDDAREAASAALEKLTKQWVKEFLDWRYIGGHALRRIAWYHERLLSRWRDAQTIYEPWAARKKADQREVQRIAV